MTDYYFNVSTYLANDVNKLPQKWKTGFGVLSYAKTAVVTTRTNFTSSQTFYKSYVMEK